MCRLNAVGTLVLVFMLVRAGPTSWAQPDETPAPAAPLLDWSHAWQAHQLIEGWVAKGSVVPDGAQPNIHVAGVAAVRVTLRWSGLMMGVGQSALQSDPGANTASGQAISHHQVANLVLLARTATDLALRAVRETLNQRRGQRPIATTDPDTTRQLAAGNVGPQLQVDLQIAHRPHTIRLARDATLAELDRQFTPGFHALMMMRGRQAGAGQTAWIWPGSALAANLSPRSQLVRLLADLGLGRDDLKRVARSGEAQLHRFDAIHIVRPGPGLEAVRLVCGKEALPLPTSPSRPRLEKMAQGLTSFLLRRVRPDGSMAGTYHPSIDRYDPVSAPPFEAALATFALASRAAMLREVDPDHPQCAAAAQAAQRGVTALIRNAQDPADGSNSSDPSTKALALMSLIESPGLEASKTQRDELAQQLLALRLDDGSFRSAPGHGSTPLKPAAQALMTAAIYRLYEQTRDEDLVVKMTVSLDRQWRDLDMATFVDVMPWLAMAQSSITRRAQPAGLQGSGSGRPWLELVEALQAKSGVRANPPGSRGHGGKPTQWALGHPNWRCAHLILVLASVLRQPNVSSDRGALPWLLDCDDAIGHLARLMFDRSDAYYVRSQSDVLGGVRKQLWDNRLDSKSSAMALLAVMHLRRTLGGLDRNKIFLRTAESQESAR